MEKATQNGLFTKYRIKMFASCFSSADWIILKLRKLTWSKKIKSKRSLLWVACTVFCCYKKGEIHQLKFFSGTSQWPIVHKRNLNVTFELIIKNHAMKWMLVVLKVRFERHLVYVICHATKHVTAMTTQRHQPEKVNQFQLTKKENISKYQIERKLDDLSYFI